MVAGRVAQSTVSRFACRLLVERDSLPARVYVCAAGFDSSRNIFLGVSLVTNLQLATPNWLTYIVLPGKGDQVGDGQRDWRPDNQRSLLTHASAGCWVEVSVEGALYHLRDSRSKPQKKSRVYFTSLLFYLWFNWQLICTGGEWSQFSRRRIFNRPVRGDVIVAECRRPSQRTG